MKKIITRFKAHLPAIGQSLWFLPSVLVVVAVASSYLFLYIDRHFVTFVSENIDFFFSGSAAAARGMLSTIAGSVITVVSIAFSLTIISMQQASAQYSPRVLRSFTSNRGNQIVLGVYIATFTYSILILRAIRESNDKREEFVPAVSLSFAIILAILCIGLLIFFINHTSNSLLATTVIKRIHNHLIEQIGRKYPVKTGESIQTPNLEIHSEDNVAVLKSEAGGFVLAIDDSIFERHDLEGINSIEVLPHIGEFVLTGQDVMRIVSNQPISQNRQNELLYSVVLEGERSPINDPLQNVRQLVDTALKGLSPGINDVTTSVYCIRYLGDAIAVLANREFPEEIASVDGSKMLLKIRQPTFLDFLEKSFLEILFAGEKNERVQREILDVLILVAKQLNIEERKRDIEIIRDRCESIIERNDFYELDSKELTKRIAELDELLS